MTILVRIGIVFVIISEMFHGRVSLNSVLLLLLMNSLSGFILELMYISLIISIRSSLTNLHGFQLLVLMPYFIEITFFVCTNRINLFFNKPLFCLPLPPLLNLETVQSPLYRQSPPPLSIAFLRPPLKIGFFCETQKY